MKQSTGSHLAWPFSPPESVALPPWGSSRVFWCPTRSPREVQGPESRLDFPGISETGDFHLRVPAVRVFPGCKPIMCELIRVNCQNDCEGGGQPHISWCVVSIEGWTKSLHRKWLFNQISRIHFELLILGFQDDIIKSTFCPDVRGLYLLRIYIYIAEDQVTTKHPTRVETTSN